MLLAELVRYFNEEAEGRYGCQAGDLALILGQAGRVSARVGPYHVESTFQPIVELHKNVVLGHEAYIRAQDDQGQVVPPGAVFQAYVGTPQMVRLDRLCRTLHTLNFLGQRQRAGGYLYLNVHRDHLAAVATNHGLVFEAVLKRCGLGTEDIVLEIQPEQGDLAKLAAWVDNFRSRGYRIAIGGLGRTLPGPAYLEGLRPDIIKVDGDKLNTELRQQLASLCKTVVALRLETEAQVKAAVEAGADLGEGLYFGGPERNCRATHAQVSWAV